MTDNVINFAAEKNRKSVEIVEGFIEQIAIETEKAMIESHLPVYDRSGILVHPVERQYEDEDGNPVTVAVLKEITTPVMLQLMNRAVRFERWNQRRREFVAVDPPENIARLILARDGFWPFPAVTGVITAPTIDRQGKIVAAPGLDRHSRLLIVNPPPLPEMPQKPTKEDAERALAVLSDLISEFAFADRASRTVALSMLISPLCRAMVHQLPLHVVRAPIAGSGKSYLTRLASAISTGRACPVIPPAEKPEEFEKRLIGVLLTGMPVISLDNLNGTLSNWTLCQALTEPLMDIRPLGTSHTVSIETRMTFFANGNNIVIASDLTRRTLLCSLDRNEERPELHVYEHAPYEQVLANRGEYIAAALTIVRAYVLAGRPGKLPPLASFNAWSDNIRSALVWLGEADPCDTIEEIRADDPERQQYEQALAAWPELDTEYTVAELITLAATERAEAKKRADERVEFGGLGTFQEPQLWSVLREIASDGKSSIDSRKLSWCFRRHLLNRIVTPTREIDGEYRPVRVKLLKGKTKHHAISWCLVKA